MNRSDLMNGLQEAIRTEESATTIYLRHLDALTERVGLDEQLAERSRKLLKYAITENERHQSILESLKSRIKGDERNDW